ncbi:MAG: glutamine-hydrolyzing carbamoyl-phosphate synthase small subunit [Phycisphaerales bacterium]|nr:glutamine-hydrolyzing carbamoyl-phosphate synthase small subunit [Phycisphaerales bacterium]
MDQSLADQGDRGAARRVGRLALQDGSVFTGLAFGAVGRKLVVSAEVVFNTAMTGYQEALTDPSYTGQILVMTVAQVGNYGVNAHDIESRKVQVSGFVIKDLSRLASNFRSDMGLDEYLAKAGVLALAEVDTRALTRRLRSVGVMQGVITDDETITQDALVARARNAPSMAGQNLVPLVGCTNNQTWSETLGSWRDVTGHQGHPTPARTAGSRVYKVLALDCGAKNNILRNLADRGCQIKLVPHDVSAAEIRRQFDAGEVDGLFISNGPGDPAAVEATIRTLREVLSASPKSVPPTFGICLGHQLLGLAVGAKTFKLPFGHRGANQPVKNLLSGRVEITSQNHGFAVDPASLASVGAEATHIHLNDGTLAGFRLTDRPVFCVQYHPEAGPGPHDSAYLFDAFIQMMQDRKPATFQSQAAAMAAT